MSVYAPLVDAFRNRDPRSQLMLEEIGRRIHEMNKCLRIPPPSATGSLANL